MTQEFESQIKTCSVGGQDKLLQPLYNCSDSCSNHSSRTVIATQLFPHIFLTAAFLTILWLFT